MGPNQRRVLIGSGIIVLAVYAISAVMNVRSASDRLGLDQRDLNDLRSMLSEIDQVADAPRVAALDLESPDEIVNRINDALREAGLNPNVLANQTPFEPQRIGQSDFTLRRVEIELNAASVAEIATFCDALRDETTGSVVRDLQLYDPRRSGTRETWNSQLILTQVVFSPKSDS